MTKKLDQLVTKILDAMPVQIIIQPHNIPDPDAIASSLGVQYLLNYKGVGSSICYDSVIEKANALKMLDLFHVNMGLVEEISSNKTGAFIILIDTQKHQSNLTEIPADHIAVIDHHEDLSMNTPYVFQDIRSNVGSCSSIVAHYFQENNILIPENIATALLYGIKMDTLDLTRKVSPLDIDMFHWLFPQAKISFIRDLNEHQIKPSDLDPIAKALQNIEIYDCIGFMYIHECNDAMLGSISDLMMTISGVKIVVSYSSRTEGIKFSIRSGLPHIPANELIRYILQDYGIGGGHNEMAGGFISQDDLSHLRNKPLDMYIQYRTIQFVDKKSG